MIPPSPPFSPVRQAVTSGFFYNTSKMSKSGDYKTIKNQHTVYIHPSSVLHKQEVRAAVRVRACLPAGACVNGSVVCVGVGQGSHPAPTSDPREDWFCVYDNVRWNRVFFFCDSFRV